MAGKTMIPLLAFAAWSGTGKTTLLKKLIPALCARGIRPGLIKHTHHDMDVDKPGKDSYELRKAGAAQTIVASQQRWALMTETPDEEELDLQFLASRMDTSKLDLILVEGFKHEEIAKIVLFRDGAGHRPEELVIDRHVIAVASDVPLNLDVALLDINDVEGLADFVVEWMQKQESHFKENRLIRNEPGEGDYQESLNYIEEDSGEKGQIVLNLQERTLTAAEWKEILPEAEKEAEEVFRNGQQADHVSGQVVLCERVKNGLISVEWKLEPDIWIDLQGNIEEENLFPGQVVNATAILSNGKNQAEYSFPICLYPSENQNETNLGKKIEQYLYNQNAEEKEVELPQNMDGVALRWEEETEKPLVIFLFLGIFAAVVILWSGKKEQQDAKKRWEEELVKDYPEMVSRLGLLLEAGMSLRQAWKKLTDTYESKRKKQRLPKRAGYEEMLLTRRELEDGMGESLAYERFGERCGLASYRRFASILTQNLKKGTVGIGRILAKESEDAFSQRKTMAQRLGEEAGTKLLFPMLMMMVVIMVILVVPACMTMHI